MALIRSLGDTSGDFVASLGPQTDAAALAAERRIAHAPPALGDLILHYADYFRTDGFLALWAGLVLGGRRRPALAATQLSRAVALNCNHWRIYAYLAAAARRAGSDIVAQKALDVVRGFAPAFDEMTCDTIFEIGNED